MSICKHGIDFAEYTVCVECDREEIDGLYKENAKLREALKIIADRTPLYGAISVEAQIAQEALEEK